MTSQELSFELNRISSIMSDVEVESDNRNGELAINDLMNIIRTNPIDDQIFNTMVIDILKMYNSLYNANAFLRQRKKAIMEAYRFKDIEKARKIIDEILDYQQNNKINSLELKIINDIKFYMKYIDPEYVKNK